MCCFFVKIFRRREIEQCDAIGVKLRFSRRMYDKRKIPKLYFTRDCTLGSPVIHIKGWEYSTYNYNYERMVDLIKRGVLTEKIK